MNKTGIPERFKELTAALIEHVVAIASLASVEASELLKHSIITLLIAGGILFFGIIGYLSLLGVVVTLAINHFGINLVMGLACVALLHFILAGLLVILLRCRPSSPAFAMTQEEVKRDIEALRSPSHPSHER